MAYMVNVNMNEVLWWIGGIGAIAAFLTPIIRLLVKASKAVKEAQATITDQCRINSEQDQLIKTTSRDVAAIKLAMLNSNKLELNKLLDRAIDRGHRTSPETEIAEAIFENYTGLGGKGVTAAKMKDFRNLSVKPRREGQ